jgi:cellulose synthase operon protein YhjQ
VKIVAVVSAKGGVGKTTVAANLSTALKYAGHQVLTVDLDPQNALRFHLGLDPKHIGGTSRATLSGQHWRDAIVETASGVFTLPYGAVNEGDRRAFEAQLEADPDWLVRGLQTLELAENDLVVLDTPPGPSVYMRQALSSANLVVIVTLPDAASYATMPMMESLVQTYCLHQPDFIDYTYVINQLDSSKQLAKDVTQVMRETFGNRVIGLIHQDESVCEALAYDQSVLDYDSQCQATRDFISCARQISALLQGQGSAA